MPESFTRGQQLAQLQGQKLVCLAPMFRFRTYGENGTEISELFPHIGSVIDEICLVRSMTTEAINHDPAHMFMNTGSQIAGRPSMGAWVTYGLGSEAENLPGFVVMVSTGKGRSPQPIAARQWGSGFLPGRFQGVPVRGQGEAVHYLGNPGGVSREQQGADVAAINALNAQHDAVVHDPEIAVRIAQYEMAFRMQAGVPELTDVRGESRKTLELYGCQPGDGSFASNCLLARRLAERGVRFIQLYHRDWDHHSLLREELPLRAREVDQACAALITDLKRRGMLDETLIVWTGEFGRTPMSQSNKGPVGRDHHNKVDVDVARRRGHQARARLRGHRRAGLRRGGERLHGARPPRHDAAPARHRPRRLQRQVPGPRREADGRRGGEGHQGHPDLTCACGRAADGRR